MKLEIDSKHLREAKEAMHNFARLHVYFEDVSDDMPYYFICKGIALALEKLGIIESAEVYFYEEMEKAKSEIEEERQQKAQQ